MSSEKAGKKQEIPRNPDGTFPKGVSGNPAGYKKGQKNFTTKVKEAMEAISEDNATDVQMQLGKKITQMALQGNERMIKLIWNYFDGKPPQSMDLTSKGERIEKESIKIFGDKAAAYRKELEEKLKEDLG